MPDNDKSENDSRIDAVAPLADEVKDNTLDDVHAGTQTGVVSDYMGNQGAICTATLECMKSCQAS